MAACQVKSRPLRRENKPAHGPSTSSTLTGIDGPNRHLHGPLQRGAKYRRGGGDILTRAGGARVVTGRRQSRKQKILLLQDGGRTGLARLQERESSLSKKKKERGKK